MSRATDPRDIISPESFSVAPNLLGLPLAKPWRRAIAFLLDLIPVGILANVGATTFIAFLSAFLVWRGLSFSRRDAPPRRTATLLRAGLSLATLVLVLNLAGALRGDDENRSDNLSADSITALVVNAQTAALREAGVSLVPEAETQPAPASDTAVFRFAAALQRRDSSALESLRPAAAEAIAGPRIRSLEQGTRVLAEQIADLRQENDELEQRADHERGGLLAWVTTIADNLGIGFGWGAIYFTTFLVLGKGKTPGKRMLGIRVIRLDARPIGWWIAFERFGGYFASVSTGLLGFLQIFWDRNRQALHDKAVETVVIREPNRP